MWAFTHGPLFVSTPPIAATLAVTEANDTLASTGLLPIVATMAETEADDTLAATGLLPIVGSLDATEDDDTLISEIPSTGQSGVRRKRQSTWADTHLYDVVPKEDVPVEIAPEPAVIPTEPEIAPLIEAVAEIIEEFDPIEIDNDLLMLIAQLAA